VSGFVLWMSLGLCSGFVPNDPELTTRLCQAQFEAKHRAVEVSNPMDEFDRVYFEWQMKQLTR